MNTGNWHSDRPQPRGNRPKSGLRSLINLAGHRSDEAVAIWQTLQQQCEQALTKLTVLERHRDHYNELLRGGMQQGMTAAATRGYLGFIRQIDDVITQQRAEVTRIEEAGLRQWERVIDARREQRTYEVLDARVVAQELATALRSSQREIENLLQRAASLPRLS